MSEELKAKPGDQGAAENKTTIALTKPVQPASKLAIGETLPIGHREVLSATEQQLLMAIHEAITLTFGDQPGVRVFLIGGTAEALDREERVRTTDCDLLITGVLQADLHTDRFAVNLVQIMRREGLDTEFVIVRGLISESSIDQTKKPVQIWRRHPSELAVDIMTTDFINYQPHQEPGEAIVALANPVFVYEVLEGGRIRKISAYPETRAQLRAGEVTVLPIAQLEDGVPQLSKILRYLQEIARMDDAQASLYECIMIQRWIFNFGQEQLTWVETGALSDALHSYLQRGFEQARQNGREEQYFDLLMRSDLLTYLLPVAWPVVLRTLDQFREALREGGYSYDAFCAALREYIPEGIAFNVAVDTILTIYQEPNRFFETRDEAMFNPDAVIATIVGFYQRGDGDFARFRQELETHCTPAVAEKIATFIEDEGVWQFFAEPHLHATNALAFQFLMRGDFPLASLGIVTEEEIPLNELIPLDRGNTDTDEPMGEHTIRARRVMAEVVAPHFEAQMLANMVIQRLMEGHAPDTAMPPMLTVSQLNNRMQTALMMTIAFGSFAEVCQEALVMQRRITGAQTPADQVREAILLRLRSHSQTAPLAQELIAIYDERRKAGQIGTVYG